MKREKLKNNENKKRKEREKNEKEKVIRSLLCHKPVAGRAMDARSPPGPGSRVYPSASAELGRSDVAARHHVAGVARRLGGGRRAPRWGPARI